MKLNRKKLVEALSTVSFGLANKEVIEQSTAFIFVGDSVATYNDEITVSLPFSTGIEGAVPAKEFLALLNKMTAEEVEFVTEDGTLKVKGGRAKAGLRLDHEIKVPLESLVIPDEWSPIPSQFFKGISYCLGSVSTDPMRPVAMCIHFNGSNIESTDNFRISRLTIDSEFSFPFLIPAASARNLIKFRPEQYAKTEGWVHFKNSDGATYSCRSIDEEFPDVAPLLKTTGTAISFPIGLSEVLDRACALFDGERVSIEISTNKITVSSENEAGWFNESIRTSYEGEDLSFDISPSFMSSVLKQTSTAEVSERLLKVSWDGFVHVVALIRKKVKEVK